MERLIDAEVLKEEVSNGSILIDDDVLECESIHEIMVYVLAKVEDFVLEKIDVQPTVDVVAEIVERLEEIKEEREYVAEHTLDIFHDGQVSGLTKAIEIVKEVGGLNELP